MRLLSTFFFFFFNDTATTEIYTLSLHDALPISSHYKPHKRPVHLQRLPTWSHPPKKRQSTRPDWVCCVRADRKSTRLNSSHSQISYAVFCLKKKKKDINTSSIYTHN